MLVDGYRVAEFRGRIEQFSNLQHGLHSVSVRGGHRINVQMHCASIQRRVTVVTAGDALCKYGNAVVHDTFHGAHRALGRLPAIAAPHSVITVLLQRCYQINWVWISRNATDSATEFG